MPTSSLSLRKGSVIRVPFLIKGTLRIPPTVETDRILRAFADSETDSGKSAGEIASVRVEDAQLLREPVIDRETMQYTGEYAYQVLPLFDPEELIERDTDRLVQELYNLPFQEVMDYLGLISSTMMSSPGFLITGDQVELVFEDCPCGRRGYALKGEIRRAPGKEVKGCGGIMASVKA